LDNKLIILSPNHHTEIVHLPPLGTVRRILADNDKIVLLSANGVYYFDVLSGKITPFGRQFKRLLGYNWHFYNNSDFVFETLPDSLREGVFDRLIDFHKFSNGRFFGMSKSGFIEYSVDRNSPEQLVVTFNEIGKYTNLSFDAARKQYILYNQEKVKLVSVKDSSIQTIDKSILKLFGIEKWQQIKADSQGRIFILEDRRLIMADTRQMTLSCIESHLYLKGAKMFVTNGRVFLAGKFGVSSYDVGRSKPRRTSFTANVKLKNYRDVLDLIVLGDKMLLNTDVGLFEINLNSLSDNSPARSSSWFELILKPPISLAVRPNQTISVAASTQKIVLDAVNFWGSGTPTYRYKLSSQSDHFNVSPTGEISIDNLERGTSHRLTIQVYDNSWVSNYYHLNLFIEPYWWQRTEWKVTLVTLSLLFFVTIIFVASTVTRRFVAKSTEKRRLQTELELRAIYSQINPHFIFNTLSTALYFISKQQTKDAYTHVSKFSKLLRSYLKSSRERFITLADEIDILKQYIELQRARFSKQFHYEITVSEELIPNQVWLPSLLLQPLIENAINHGLFNKGDSGFLNVSFSKGTNDTELICIIDDNGIGRVRAKELNRRYRKEKSSYGTELTRELIDIFKRYEHMDITLEYLDKTEPETGTTVKLTIRNVRTVSPA
jgi:two-component sensor histidine kinase